MDEKMIDDRLSQMSTCWSLLADAHGGSATVLGRAQAVLIERYQGAVYRYLVGMLRDPDAADDVFQEFALRIVRGNFHKADEAKGRFRNYVKTSLVHLVREYRSKRARTAMAELTDPEAVAGEVADARSDAVFLDHWRKTLLDRAWESLQRQERAGGPPYHRVLRLRTEKPEWSTGELTAAVNVPAREPLSEAAVRKILQRGREMFTEALLDEVARSVGNDSIDELEQEIIDLGFQAYCSKALQKRRAGG